MSIYKKRIYASCLLILFALLFISAGYYYVSQNSFHQNQLKLAGTFLEKIERQSFLISEHLYRLSAQSKKITGNHQDQIDTLQVTSHLMKTSFNSFNEIIHNEALLFKMNGSDFQTALHNFNIHLNAFIKEVEIISATSNDKYPVENFKLDFASAELELRKDFATISNLLRSESDHIEMQKNNLKAIILGTLMMALILTLILVIPSVRLSVIARKKLEVELSKAKDSECVLRSIIDTSTDLIFILDKQHKYKMVNKAFSKSLDLSPKECIGKDDIELGIFERKHKMDKDLEQKKRKENEAIFKMGEVIKNSEELLIINKRSRIHSTMKFPLKDAKGNIWGLLGRSQDITERINAHRIMHQSEQKYRHLFIDNPLPMWIVDTVSLRFLEVNKEATNLYGYTENEFLCLSIFDILPVNEKERIVQIVKHIASGHTSFRKRKTCNHIKKNGENIFVDVDAQMFDFNGRQTFLFSAKDVTAAIKLQEQIVKEKVNHQREITKTIIATQEKERSGIAKELHDNVNQILTSAKLHIECISSESLDLHRKTSIELISSGIQEIRKLSRSIISPSLHQVGLIHSINELLNNIRLTSFARVEFNHQTFVEDSIESDLELTVYRIIQEQTTNILKYAEATIIRVDLEQYENYLQLVITDNGKGFDMKKSHKGVGFTNMMNRAQIHAGDFRLNSSPGNGCSLTIDFRLNTIVKRRPLLYSA